jgi:predicted permease
MSSRKRGESDFSAEIAAHIALETERLQEQGLSYEQARTAAYRAFGNVIRAQERFYESQHSMWWDNLLQDVRYGARWLRKSPGFAYIAILTIALGIGATTAIFSVVDATLLHPLPFSHPEQLVSIVDDLPGVGAHDVGMSVPEWHDLERSGIFQYVAPMGGGGSVNLTGASHPIRASFLAESPNYFALLGVNPQLGRAFNPDDHTPGFVYEALISDGLWKRAFGRDPQILGRSLRLDNDLYRVAGVMPPGYHDPGRTAGERDSEVWAATNFDAPPTPAPVRSAHFMVEVIGRLKPGLTLAQAQSRVDALVASLRRQFPNDYPVQSGWRVQLVPLKDTVVGDVSQSLILLLGAVSLVLLIGCVNIANLLLARASGRAREMAVRQALGADRTRLVSQLLTESLLLSILGGALGLATLFCAKKFLLQLIPHSLPRLRDISIDLPVLLFALGATLIAGLIFGLAPALHAGRLDLIHFLKQESRGSVGSREQARTRRILVISEFAFSLVLMIAAGLLLRSFWDLLKVRPGFNPENVMTVGVWLPIPNDPNADIYHTAKQEAPFLQEVLLRTRRLSGVEEVAISDAAAVPLGHGQFDLRTFPLIFAGHETPTNETPLINFSIVTPEYFHLLGMNLLHGRWFADSDTDSAPAAALVNEAFARTYFPAGDVLGKRLKLPVQGKPSSSYWATIIGVLANARTESLAEAASPQLYLSMYQRAAKDLTIFLRGHLDTGAIPAQVREQVQAVNPELPVFGGQTLDAVVSDSLSQRRFSMQIIGLFAVTALLLAGLGIYGVISYIVSEHTRDIGIRLALGAQSGNIFGDVLRQGLQLAGAGAAIGLAAALIMARLMSGLLFGVRPTDPLTFTGVALLLILVALLACYIPACRAVRVDPIVALRHE